MSANEKGKFGVLEVSFAEWHKRIIEHFLKEKRR
jgi:hypothetical protein